MRFLSRIKSRLREFIFPAKRDCIIVWLQEKPVIRQYKKPLKHGMGMTRKDAEEVVAAFHYQQPRFIVRLPNGGEG